MAYDANPAATYDPTTGTIVPVTWLDLINTDFAAIGAAWTSFTPAMTFTGGGSLTIGNGTISGAYIQLGKTLWFRIWLSVGSSTTFGTGDWRFTLPNSRTAVSGPNQAVSAWAFDTSGTDFYSLAGIITGGATYAYCGSDGTSGPVTTTVPFTWATGDQLTITGMIETA